MTVVVDVVAVVLEVIVEIVVVEVMVVVVVESGDEVMVRDVVVDVDVVICHDHHDYCRTRPLSMNKNCYYYCYCDYYDRYSDDDDDCAFVASAGTIGWQRRLMQLAPDSHSRNYSSTFWSVSSFCAPCSHTCHGDPS